MKRRDFSLAATAVGLAPWIAAPSAHAQAAFKAGTDYLVLPRTVSVDAPADKVEVVEFFSYNCPHCAEFEPMLEDWLKKLPPYAAFRRVPVPFVGSDVATKAKLYYALEAMGKVDTYQPIIFKTIHRDRQPLTGDAAVLAWAAKQPDLGTKFAEVFNSFTVASKVKRATQLTEDYKVGGVPALGVAGKWYVDGETARGLPRALQVVEFLVGQARKS
ncbi:thiol:disulfide interchange protein DsbA/DsbL [Variovorax dokdonensis]|uniref:Thiol:disulfide interchange protein n=1 Tax=Variovorax dokdonensis TaxID=344883 RepID=A0ABT7NAD1_9BURK|nr:thiol:disulfide interchange protein DsbA/DsbL [Variovorax dokdonensis]MDM0044883.1 thiol:disulfide interchange protein DsbA/DsbL [Variovorax dokdonensis]